MYKNILIHVSTITGNTRTLVKSVADYLTQHYHSVCYLENEEPDTEQIRKADLVILGFWCWRGTIDKRTQEFLSSMEGKPVLVFGTLGYYPDSPYGEKLRSQVTDLVNDRNTCLGVFLSQGRIPPERTERRRNLPVDAPHHLDDEGYRRHLESRNHPNVQDLQNAVSFLMQKLV